MHIMSNPLKSLPNESYLKYLHAISTNWSSREAGRMLTDDLILYIQPRFAGCSTPIKVRILMSFLYCELATRTACKQTLSDILTQGEQDRDDWVRKLSRIMQPFVITGRLDLKETDTEIAFRIIHKLDEGQRNHYVHPVAPKPPLESVHMCNALEDFTLSHQNMPVYELHPILFKNSNKRDIELPILKIERAAMGNIRKAAKTYERKYGSGSSGIQ